MEGTIFISVVIILAVLFIGKLILFPDYDDPSDPSSI
jgi:hypothetical protein